MAQLIVMPKFGLTMTEGTIASWNVAVGDAIAEGDILCEIETDKLTNEFESPKAGVLLKIIEGDGATVTCLEPIAIIGEANEDISGLSGGRWKSRYIKKNFASEVINRYRLRIRYLWRLRKSINRLCISADFCFRKRQ